MKTSNRRAIHRAVSTVIESLESRTLLSADLLTGTPGVDHFIVSVDSSTNRVVVSGASNAPAPVLVPDFTGLTINGMGGSDTLEIQSGNVTLLNDGNTGGTSLSVTVDANATLNFATNQHLASLSLGAGSLAAMPRNGSILVTGGLTIAGSTNAWTGSLDLGDGDLIVNNGNLPNLTNQIKAGFNATGGGSWNGIGVRSVGASTDAAHLAALGVLTNVVSGTTPLYSTFDGQTTVSTDVLVKNTYFGDANLDGQVDGSDYSLIDNGYLTHATGWRNGDFNYDGVVDGSDYTLIDNAFNTQPYGRQANATAGAAYTISAPYVGGIASFDHFIVNWGDGVIQQYNGSPTSFTHTYAAGLPNTYVYIGAYGNNTVSSGQYNPTIFRENPMEDIGVNAPSVAVAVGGNSTVPEGSPYTLNLPTTTTAGATITGWSFAWGDGTTSTLSSAPTSTTHTFANGVASATIVATATKSGGTSTSESLAVGIVPSAPTSLTATPLDAGQIELSWQDPSLIATGETLDRATNASFTTGLVSTPLSAGVAAYVASGLSASTTYYFRVRNSGTAGPSAYAVSSAVTKVTGSTAAPIITTAASVAAASNTTKNLSVSATDPASNTINYTWQTVSVPSGAAAPTLMDGNSIVATFSAAGNYVLRAVATDSVTGLSVTSDVAFAVAQVVSGVNLSPTVAGVANGNTRQFTATAVDQFNNPLVTQPPFTWSLASGSGGSVSTSGLYHAPTVGTASGSATVQATASGFTGTATVTTADPSASAPTVSIASLTSTTLTQDTPVSIVADSPNDDLTSWTLSLTPKDGGGSIVLASGTTEIGAAPSSAVQVAVIHPTLLQQGIYQLSLTATDPEGTNSTGFQIQITSQLKLGNFSQTATDLTINTPGIPLTVSRVYDSTTANQNRGDFGPGWRMELNDVNFTTTAFLGRNSGNGTLPGGYPAISTSDLYYITLPGGQEDAFQFFPVDSGTQDGGIDGAANNGEIYYPAFRPLNNHDSLTVDTSYDNGVQDTEGENNSSSQISLFRSGGDNTYFTNFDGFYSFNLVGNYPYNPAFSTGGGQNNPSYGGYFKLTTQQGITYTIDGPTGRVSSESDLNGNTVTFSPVSAPTSITSSNGQSITVDRSGGHITSIIDPNGNSVVYGYDGTTGDLTSVTQRATTGSGNDVTTYAYSAGYTTVSGAPPLLTQVIDSRGVTLFTAVYAASGGLTNLKDVNGNLVPIHVQSSGTSNSIETSTDLLGNTTENVYNSNGQLLSKIQEVQDPLNPAVIRYSVVVSQYNGLSSLITLQSNPFFSDEADRFTAGGSATITSPPPNGWAINRTYDGSGNLSTDTDSVGRETQYMGYFSFSDPNGGSVEFLGKPDTVQDSAGNDKIFTYDGAGNLQTSTDPEGLESAFDHNSAGQVTNSYRVFSGTNQLVSTNAYNSAGQLLSTTDYNNDGNVNPTDSVAHSFVNDADGKPTLSYYVWTDPTNSSNQETVVDRTDYDKDERAIESRHYVLAGSLSFTAASDLNSYTPLTSTFTTYNSDGLAATTTDQYGGITYSDYNAKGDLIRTVYPDGTEVRAVYDTSGKLLYQTDRYYTGATSLASPGNGTAARATFYVYDQLGRVKETDRVDGVYIIIEQDTTPGIPAGVDRSRLAAFGAGTTLSTAKTIYNSAGFAADQIGTDNQTTAYTYDLDGRILTTTNALNQTTTYTYNQNSTTHRIWNTVEDANSHTTTTDLDADGRTILITYDDGSYIATTYTRTLSGQTVASFRQQFSSDTPIETDSKFDLAGRLVEVDQPNPSNPTSSSGKLIWAYGYDVYGDETRQTDPLGHITTSTFDAEGRPTGRTLPDGTTSDSTTYDSYGRPSIVTDYKGNKTKSVYFNSGAFAGQLQETDYFTPTQNPATDTPTQKVTYAYNSVGKQSQVTEYTGTSVTRTTTYSYDLDGNVLSELVYGAGHTPGVNSPDQQLYYAYDPATDRQIRVYTGNPSSPTTDERYGYDALGRLASVTVYKVDGSTPSNASAGSTTLYNATGGTSTTTLPNTVDTYDPAGNLHTEALPNGYLYTYTYDDLNRLTNENVSTGSNTVATYAYTLTTDGQRKTETDHQLNVGSTTVFSNTTITWGYDGLNRLTSEAYTTNASGESSYTDSYTYDNAGNRLTKVHTVGSNVTSISYGYDTGGDDRLMTETATGTGAYSISYGYDANGSMTSKNVTGTGAQTDSYTYDLRNRMTSATVAGTTTSYAYDFQNNLVSTTQSATTTNYLIDDQNPTDSTQVLEQASSLGGIPSVTYLIGHNVFGQATASTTLSYLVADGHGSTRIAANSSGGVTARFDYDAFGNAIGFTAGSASTAFLYSDQFFDNGVGQYNLRARRYDTTTGRFSSMDPFFGTIESPSTLNHFIYTADNAPNASDPNGRELVDIGISEALDAGLESSQAAPIASVSGAAGELEADVQVAEETEEAVEQIIQNQRAGSAFERAALQAKNLLKNTDTFTQSILKAGAQKAVNFIPDAYEWGRGLFEIKNVAYLALSSQLAAEGMEALEEGIPFNLIVRVGSQISQPVIDLIKQTGGTIQTFDPVKMLFGVY
jgi:RHS repeat-associated protein